MSGARDAERGSTSHRLGQGGSVAEAPIALPERDGAGTGTNLLQRVRAALPELPGVSRQCADFVLANAWEVQGLSIHDLAGRIGVSAPAVNRFARRVGYSGYREFSRVLTMELGRIVGAAYAIPEPLARQLSSDGAQVGVNDRPLDVVSRVFALELAALQDTWRSLDKETVEQAVSALAGAQSIMFVSTGAGQAVADLAVYRLRVLGLRATAAADPSTIVSELHQLQVGDVVVGVTYHGEARNVLDALALARERELTTISVTAAPGSSVTRLAGIQLVASSQAEALGFGQFASRITTATLLEGLITAVAWQRRETCLPHATEVEQATWRVNASRVPRKRGLK